MTLSPVVILIGLRISTTATLGPAVEPLVPSSGLVASVASESLADIVLPDSPLSLDELTGQEITFYNVNTRETERFFLRFDGEMSPDDEARITHLFRCKRTGHELAPDRGLLQIFARLADRYEGHVFEVLSAHRNNRATSRTSRHRSSHALDVRIRGTKIKEVRSFVWKMDAPIGLGYYREQQFLHIDYRPEEGKIAWDQRHENAAYHYHPAWSLPPAKKAAKAHKDRPSRKRSLRSAQPQT